MIEGWPEKIASAQNVLSYTLNGKAVLPIRYGDEHDDFARRPKRVPRLQNS
jgi:hypothetical protein